MIGGTRNPRRPPFGRKALAELSTVRDGLSRMPALARQGRRRGQQLLGGRRRALHHRRADPGQRPAPRRLDAGRVDAGGPALPQRLRRVPVRRRGLQLLRRARRDHRPQRRHRLGVHQPRPRRHRPLRRTGLRRHLALRRQGAAAAHPHRDHRGGRRQGRPAHRAVHRPRPDRVRRRRRAGRRRAGRQGATSRPRGGGVRRVVGVDRPRAPPDGRRHPRAQPGGGLGRLPGCPRRLRGALAERRVRRPRGPHRLPGARADPDPQVGERRLDPRRGLAPGERLDG